MNEYKLNPTESQELKQKEQNSVIMSKRHACDTFVVRRVMGVKEEVRAKGARESVIPFHWWLSTRCGG